MNLSCSFLIRSSLKSILSETSLANSTAQLSFIGEPLTYSSSVTISAWIGSSITLLGSYGRSIGSFTVQIDSGPLELVNRTLAPTYAAQQPIYIASDLDPLKKHTLTVAFTGDSDTSLQLDGALVYGTTSVSTRSSSRRCVTTIFP